MSWFDGADGSKAFDAVGTDADACEIAGDLCVLRGSVPVYSFNRAYTDEACTTDAYYPQVDCDGEGVPVLVMDECYQPTLIGQTGPEATGTAWRQARDGSCVEEAPSGGWFGTCLQSVIPATAAQAVALSATTQREVALELVTLSTSGGTVVDAHFQLPDGMRCEPGRTEDDEVRCVPQRQVQQAYDAHGGGGSWVTEAVDDTELPALEPARR